MTTPTLPLADLDLCIPCRAHLGDDHGYQITLDQISVNADLAVPVEWIGKPLNLELWACHQPYLGGELYGSPIFSQQLIANNGHHHLTGPINPPASGNSLAMVLLLSSISANGERIVHDYFNYPQLQNFYNPHLEGAVVWHWDGNNFHGQLDAITNPRQLDNISGTLALELWSMALPYYGGAINGQQLGGVTLGNLNGSQSWQQSAFTIAASANQPQAGQALVLILSEWSELGFQPRDLRVLTAATTLVEADTAKAETTASSGNVVAATPATTPAAVPTKATAVTAASSKKAAKEVAAAKTAPAAVVGDSKVSINDASVVELAAVKGLSSRLAEAIVAGRPYSTLDGLLAIKGIGQRLLNRIRSFLRC